MVVFDDLEHPALESGQAGVLAVFERGLLVDAFLDKPKRQQCANTITAATVNQYGLIVALQQLVERNGVLEIDRPPAFDRERHVLHAKPLDDGLLVQSARFILTANIDNGGVARRGINSECRFIRLPRRGNTVNGPNRPRGDDVNRIRQECRNGLRRSTARASLAGQHEDKQ